MNVPSKHQISVHVLFEAVRDAAVGEGIPLIDWLKDHLPYIDEVEADTVADYIPEFFEDWERSLNEIEKLGKKLK